MEEFNGSKLLFKKKEINSFIQNIKRLLISKSVKFKVTLPELEITGVKFEWTAFNFLLVYKIMKNQKEINKLFICKFFKI